jgi:hypothetical protein
MKAAGTSDGVEEGDEEDLSYSKLGVNIYYDKH